MRTANLDGKIQQSNAEVKQTDAKPGTSAEGEDSVQLIKRPASINIKNSGTYVLLLLLLSYLMNALGHFSLLIMPYSYLRTDF